MENNDMEFDNSENSPKCVKDLVAMFNNKNLDHMANSFRKPKTTQLLSKKDQSTVKMINELRQSGCLIPSFNSQSFLSESLENMSEHIHRLQSFKSKYFEQVIELDISNRSMEMSLEISMDMPQSEYESAQSTKRTTAHT